MVGLANFNVFKAAQEYIVVTVNCRGAMGKGVALECRERYPKTYRHYQALCRQGKVKPGKPFRVNIERPLILFPTKDDWRNPSQLEWIEQGLKILAENAHLWKSIAMPPLGCSNGGLDWDKVNQLIHKHLEKLDNLVIVHRF